MKEKKTGEFIGSVVGNIVALVLVNTVMLWRPWTRGVVLESWVDILWAADLSILVQIVGNLILAFYRPNIFHAFMKVVFTAAGLLSIIVFYIVFPLDFSKINVDWLNTLARVFLMVGMGGSLIGIVAGLAQFFTAMTRVDTPRA
jgi:hypothetical protein